MHRKGKPKSATKSGGGESVSLISFLDHRSHASNSTTPVKEWNEYNILEPNGTDVLNELEKTLEQLF